MPKAEIKIEVKSCKGCEICVRLCPAKCLVMKDFVAHVEDINKCTACMSCELRCPDFAISVNKL